MRRTLLLLCACLGAPVALAEEPPPLAPAAPVQQEEAAPAPEAVADALLSARPEEQRRGEAELTAALRAAPERAAEFVRRLGAALRARVAPHQTLERVLKVETPASPAPQEAPPAVEPQPLAPLPPAAAAPAPPAPQPIDPLADPPAPAPPESTPATESKPEAELERSAGRVKAAPWDLKVWAVSVAAREVAGLIPPGMGVNTPVRGSRGQDGSHTVQGPAEWAPAWAQTALRSADATPLAERVLRLGEAETAQEPLGRELRYRRAAAQTKDGAWAVETDALHPGLALTTRLQDATLKLEASWIEVAQPMASERVRPAANVDPIELDRPDWSVARRRVTLSLEKSPGTQGTAALLVLPGLLPDPERRLVLVLSLLPR